MNSVRNNSEVESRSTERSLNALNARDSALPHLAINDKNDNVMQLRLQERQSLSSYRLTRDPNNAFTIDMGSKVEVNNQPREVSRHPVPATDKGSIYAFEKTPHRHAYDVLHVAEKPLSADQIAKRIDVWIGHSLTGLEQRRNGMQDSEYRNKVSQLVNFEKDMHEFRATAADRGSKATDVEKTFQQINRLMLDDAGGQFDRDTRRTIAEQIMHYAAHPTSINQGNHNTCMEAALESMMFTRHPGDAAKFISDIALTGTFVSQQKFPGKDGQLSPLSVNVQLEPDAEAEESRPDGRSFASEIFQVAAANLAYANQDKLWQNHRSYVQRNVEQQYNDFEKTKDWTDTGERIVDSRTGEPIDSETRSPDLPDNALRVMARAIAGEKNRVDTAIVNDSFRNGESEGTICIKTLQDLKNALSSLKTERRLPVMIKVNVNCEPFYMDNKLCKGEEGGAHAVTIRDYDASTGAVMVDNQWGDNVDHLRNKPINVRDLFVATLSDADAAKMLEHMIEEDKRNGLTDPLKRMQQLRLSNSANELSDDAYEHRVREEVHAAASRWNGLPAKEKADERDEFIAMTRDLDIIPRTEMLAEVFKSRIISPKEYEAEKAYMSEFSRYFRPKIKPPSDEIIPPKGADDGTQSSYEALRF